MEMTAAALWLNTAFAGLDEWAAVAVHRLYELAPGFFTPFLTLITYMGKGGIFLILLSFALMMFRPTRRYGTAMLLAVAIGALITNLTVKPLVARPRPYTWEGSVYKEYWIMLGRHTESDKSFPSGHMTAAMAASTAVFLCGRQAVSAALPDTLSLYASPVGSTRATRRIFFPAINSRAGIRRRRGIPFHRIRPGRRRRKSSSTGSISRICEASTRRSPRRSVSRRISA